MKPTPIRFKRFSFILECLLVALIMILAAAFNHQVLAGNQSNPSNQDPSAVQLAPFSPGIPINEDTVGSAPPLNRVALDNTTLAAVLAAENAALTSPQHLVDIPFISR